jgi:molybdopterin converting factor subunit 1
MNVSVRLFARAKDLAGSDAVQVALPAGATVGDLRRKLQDDWPRLAELLPRCAIAVGGEFAGDTTPLEPDQEVAVLPPVSGGSVVE